MSDGENILTIAIDGPAASGKGTLARMIARHYGLGYLDTGSLYRATALSILAEGGDFHNAAYAAEKAKNLIDDAILDPRLREPGVGEGASIIAKFPQVRDALLKYQQHFASHPPGAVLDGRDIGTVILPHATVKLFVTARAEERAKRRFLELQPSNPDLTYEDVLTDIKKRDQRDEGREIAPLQQTADAYLLDTTNLDINAAMEAAIGFIDQKLVDQAP